MRIILQVGPQIASPRISARGIEATCTGLFRWVSKLHYLLEYQLRREAGLPPASGASVHWKATSSSIGTARPLDFPTAPKPQTPRSIAFALVHPPSSHLSLSTAPTSVMALLKLSTLALLALRAAAVFAAEVNVSQLSSSCCTRPLPELSCRPLLYSVLRATRSQPDPRF